IRRKTIGFSTNHGELDSMRIFSFRNSLLDYYNVKNVDLKMSIPSVDLIIIPKPQRHFDELEKYHLDQYIMKGGKVIFLIDKLEAKMDSASKNENFAFPYDINLDDLLFRYGVRINTDLIQDNYAATYPIVTNTVAGQPQIMKLPWPFYPIINQLPNHTITKNLEAVLLRFASTIDTVKATGIKKTPLLFTSQYSRAVNARVQVTVNDLRKNLNPEKLNMSYIPVAYLLEGSFTSVFKNRILPESSQSDLFLDQGEKTKILVVSDGDIITNDVNPSSKEPFELGAYPYMSGVHFGNLDFMMNALSFMLNENGIISAKNKEIAIRPLDKVKIANEKTKWQLINLLLPILIINLLGVLLYYIRKKKYSQFKSDL
ncbi:MAG: gliding motility-associated ABC transporter substrate-binding protein GldG, partial [Cyclobacteriaceae bacterium]|nr:gliding motility-associated ABC transporter substrate-binding protein GldG [Cyclobacteriaceae bacterium]